MRRLRNTAGSAAVSLVVLVAGCKKSNQYVPPPAAKVSVAKPVSETITRYLEATGNTVPAASVDLVARVQGFIQAINYTDGAAVKPGDLLFTIEPLPFQAKLAQAQAAEAVARAQLANAQIAVSRLEVPQKNAVASAQTLEDARAQRDIAQANVSQAQANTQIAAINYGYTQVVAPFAGRMSAHLVSAGDVVRAGRTRLATIVQMQPISVTFPVSEPDAVRLRGEAGRNGRAPGSQPTIPVEVGLQGETGYPHRGHVDYIAPAVDSATGTLLVRGVLDNANGGLLPGAFARVRVPLQTGVNALLLPDTALGADQGGRYVLVVGPDNVVAQRHVTTGPSQGMFRVIETGLAPDDKVVVDGLQRAVPGETVDAATVMLIDTSQ
jgi:RND family efflux transporter MFP subunit